jgi:hypothetical protein
MYIKTQIFSSIAAGSQEKKSYNPKKHNRESSNHPKHYPILHKNTRIIFPLSPQVSLSFFSCKPLVKLLCPTKPLPPTTYTSRKQGEALTLSVSLMSLSFELINFMF